MSRSINPYESDVPVEGRVLAPKPAPIYRHLGRLDAAEQEQLRPMPVVHPDGTLGDDDIRIMAAMVSGPVIVVFAEDIARAQRLADQRLVDLKPELNEASLTDAGRERLGLNRPGRQPGNLAGNYRSPSVPPGPAPSGMRWVNLATDTWALAPAE